MIQEQRDHSQKQIIIKKKRWIIATLMLSIAVILVIVGLFVYRANRFDAEKIYAQYTDLNNATREIEIKYTSNDGVVSTEDIPDLITEVADYMDKMQTEGVVEYMEKHDTSVFVEFCGGIGYLYSPPNDELMAGDELGKIVTVEPYPDNVEFVAEYALGGKSPDKAADIIERALPTEYEFTDNLDSFELSDVDKLAGSKIILWYGHGDYVEKYGSLLGTSIPIENQDTVLLYAKELMNNELFIGNKNFLITPKYIDHHLNKGDLNDSLVFLAACSATVDDRLANAFIGKGASLVVGPDAYARIRYNLYMLYDFINGLTKQYSDGTYWTAEDALEYAKKENGEQDSTFIAQGAKYKLIYPDGKSGYRLHYAKVESPEPSSEQEDFASTYLRESVLPHYPETTGKLEIPFSTYTDSSLGAHSFYITDEKPIAFLASKIDDYNGDGINDLMTFTLEAQKPETFHAEGYSLPSTQNNLAIVVRVYIFNNAGNAVQRNEYVHIIRPTVVETVSIAQVGNKLIFMNSLDDNGSTDPNSGYSPITNLLCDHEDSIQVFNGNDLTLSIYFQRAINHISHRKDAEYVKYTMENGYPAEQETLFYMGVTGFSTNQNTGVETIDSDIYGIYDNEQTTCEFINSKLVETTDDSSFNIRPYSWDGRWQNNFRSDVRQEVMITAITLTSKSSNDEGISGKTTVELSEYAAPDENVLSDSQIALIKSELQIPDNLQVDCVIGEQYYWEAGDRWLINVAFTMDGITIACADVDVNTSELVRGILNYAQSD